MNPEYSKFRQKPAFISSSCRSTKDTFCLWKNQLCVYRLWFGILWYCYGITLFEGIFGELEVAADVDGPGCSTMLFRGEALLLGSIIWAFPEDPTSRLLSKSSSCDCFWDISEPKMRGKQSSESWVVFSKLKVFGQNVSLDFEIEQYCTQFIQKFWNVFYWYFRVLKCARFFRQLNLTLRLFAQGFCRWSLDVDIFILHLLQKINACIFFQMHFI